MTPLLGSRPVVVSPHLDDGVLSLGATIAVETQRGIAVDVLTVFANDPASRAPAKAWDRACGFATEGQAASVRREEDRQACELVGALPKRLPSADSEYVRERSESAVWEPPVRLSPMRHSPPAGFPLAHPTSPLAHAPRARTAGGHTTGRVVRRAAVCSVAPHRPGRREWAAPSLDALRGLLNATAIALRTRSGRAMQQPSAPGISASDASGLTCTATQPDARARRQKRQAVSAYRSQLEGFGTHSGTAIALYEHGRRGEGSPAAVYSMTSVGACPLRARRLADSRPRSPGRGTKSAPRTRSARLKMTATAIPPTVYARVEANAAPTPP